ncbi:tyrosine--tRNA ligase [Egicoccus halophilus]|uniref:Tyrosine--tRNA ligase n=1 Tax=Egicoccus halophilus TaxID=1670830 RepID=A0A8J3A5M3_9ACTN|nr:tyrosine--tRNA ligase [Egicoccus halophilus]GGI03236.1 tyrosine--tRNA ligase [Egicoccus halophilus]
MSDQTPHPSPAPDLDPPPAAVPSPSGDRNALDVLRERGFVQDVTDEQGLRELFDAGPVTFYVGFDPTAASLHIGHLVGIMAMAHLKRLGHRPLALAGGATGRIGDPSFRDAERELLDDDALERNLAGIRTQLDRAIGFEDGNGQLVDNFEWTRELSALAFLRDVGKFFSVNQMIARESVRKRLTEREQGISYTEFSYQLLQAYDFSVLAQQYGCRLQGGGSDQWGNITAGVDLTRRLHGIPVFGMVWPLITRSDGRKFSKSDGTAIWLDPELTSPYAYYQWFLNVPDADVIRFLKLFTFVEVDEIADLERQHGDDPARRVAHRVLAREATRVVHGDAGVEAAERATGVLFGDEPFAGLDDATLSAAFEEAPSVVLTRTRLDEGLGLLELLTEVGAAASNGEARRLVQQGAVRVNNAVVEDARSSVGPDDLASERTLVVRVGKKRYFLARFH